MDVDCRIIRHDGEPRVMCASISREPSTKTVDQYPGMLSSSRGDGLCMYSNKRDLRDTQSRPGPGHPCRSCISEENSSTFRGLWGELDLMHHVFCSK